MIYPFDKSAKQISGKPPFQQMETAKASQSPVEEEEENLCCWSHEDGNSLAARFCMDSSLHGLKYIGQPRRHVLERLFWLGAFILSASGGMFMILTLWNKYWESPVVTVFQPTETPVDLIPFPAITVCNVNNVRKSRAVKYITRAKDPNLTFTEKLEAYGDLYDLNHVCEASTTFAERFNVSDGYVIDPALMTQVLKVKKELPPSDPTEILQKATQNCTELILLCLWLDEVQDCNTFFQPVETDYGYCCTFNVVPLTLLLKFRNNSRDSYATVKEWNHIIETSNHNLLLPAIENYHRTKALPKFPHRQVYHGRSSGLSLLIDPDLEEYFCCNTDANGFVIGTTHPLDFPRVRDHGIAVRPNSETFMSIKPDLTIADESIASFNIEKRQCYIAEEYQLRYYAYYTASNCVDECIANHTFETCQCIQYYMPRSNDQSLCSPDQFQCTERVRKTVVQKGLLKECRDCLPMCNDLGYQVETTFLNMRDGIFKSDVFPIINRSLNGRNMTIVHMYMGVESTYPRFRKELYSMVDLISSTGGLLSLCLGFSLLSLLEICYFSTIRVCIRSYRQYGVRNRSSKLLSQPWQTVTSYNGWTNNPLTNPPTYNFNQNRFQMIN